LDELDGILLKLEQIMSIQPNIFTLQEMDVIYFVDDIQFIRDFLWEWMRDKISLISQNDYRRLDGQLQTLKKLLP
jgi:hypothetical protein